MTVLEGLKQRGFEVYSLKKSHSNTEIIEGINFILENDKFFEELKSNLDFRENFLNLINFYYLKEVIYKKEELSLTEKANKRLQELYDLIQD